MVEKRLVLERIHRLVGEGKMVVRGLVLERIHRLVGGGGRGRWSRED